MNNQIRKILIICLGILSTYAPAQAVSQIGYQKVQTRSQKKKINRVDVKPISLVNDAEIIEDLPDYSEVENKQGVEDNVKNRVKNTDVQEDTKIKSTSSIPDKPVVNVPGKSSGSAIVLFEDINTQLISLGNAFQLNLQKIKSVKGKQLLLNMSVHTLKSFGGEFNKNMELFKYLVNSMNRPLLSSEEGREKIDCINEANNITVMIRIMVENCYKNLTLINSDVDLKEKLKDKNSFLYKYLTEICPLIVHAMEECIALGKNKPAGDFNTTEFEEIVRPRLQEAKDLIQTLRPS